MTNTSNRAGNLLPFNVIAAATNGDTDAICAILKHYEGYIAKLSTRTLRDEDGNTYLYVDEEMRNRLKIRLIARIPFRASRNGLFVIPSKRTFKVCFDRLINADCSLTKKAFCGRIGKQTHSVRVELYGKCATIPFKVERVTFLP